MKRPAASGTQASSGPRALNYEVYRLTVSEYLAIAGKALAVAAAFIFVFYRSFLLFFLAVPAALLYPFRKKRDLVPRRRRKLLLEFREGLSVLSGNLSAGYSMENALRESVQELTLLYGESGLIVNEFEHLSHLVSMNVPVEDAMSDFAERSGLEDIRNFARVLKLSKRTGGTLVSIIEQTARTIGDRIQVKEEILTLTAAQRFEQNIMNVVPLLIILYIDFSSPGFFTVMYETIAGRIVMTVCLAVYLLSVRLAAKILEIEV